MSSCVQLSAPFIEAMNQSPSHFTKANFDVAALAALLNNDPQLKSMIACVRAAGHNTPIDARAISEGDVRFSQSKSRLFLHIGDQRFQIKTLVYKNGTHTEIQPDGIYVHLGQRPTLIAPSAVADTARTGTRTMPTEAPANEENGNETPLTHDVLLAEDFKESADAQEHETHGRKKGLMPLYLRIVNGLDTDALAEYFVAEQKSLHHFAFKFVRDEADADDVVQTAFVKVLKSLQEKKAGTSDSLCREPAYFGTWVHQIIKNNAFNLNNMKARSAQEHFDTVNEYAEEGVGQRTLAPEASLDQLTPDAFQDPLLVLLQKEAHASLVRDIARLSEGAASDNRLELLLASSMKLSGLDDGDIAGLPKAASYEDLAVQHNLPTGTVRSRIHRARQIAEKLAPR